VVSFILVSPLFMVMDREIKKSRTRFSRPDAAHKKSGLKLFVNPPETFTAQPNQP